MVVISQHGRYVCYKRLSRLAWIHTNTPVLNQAICPRRQRAGVPLGWHAAARMRIF